MQWLIDWFDWLIDFIYVRGESEKGACNSLSCVTYVDVKTLYHLYKYKTVLRNSL